MGKNSHIEWTHHTFNPWWGCTKVSPACKNCYAENLANRFGGAAWGAAGERRFFGENHWKEPLRWNREAARKKCRFRVFCASMADVFEDRRDLDEPRKRLWKLIDDTPELDWLLLTKRPEAVKELTPWGKSWPKNIWLGTSVENQAWADRRLPILLSIPAKIKFLSCEPLLGPLDLSKHLKKHRIDWIITGGESGPGSRPMHPSWVRQLRDFCRKENIAFHFKQWGNFAPAPQRSANQTLFSFPSDGFTMVSRHKALNGRRLDGKEHNELPQVT